MIRRFVAASLLSVARPLIRVAHRIYPPQVTLIDARGKRWTLRGGAGRPVEFTTDSAVYTPGPVTQEYVDRMEAGGWN